ncbi:MAG: trypsin-like peptidase domain-containing protein, partial [Euzebyales bacterium]|nr:trypsin-like peptidase domain-containing protein [Euzebyales bacterium]
GVTAAAARNDRVETVAAPESVQAPAVEVRDGARSNQVEAVAEAVLPTVVQIDIQGGGGLGDATGNGSGVVYRSDGHILTNNHVVDEARNLRVVFADGEKVPAEVVGRDPLSDLAVVKVERGDLPAIQVADSAKLRVGQLAVAVGSPFGLEGSVTAGVVSAVNRPISVGDGIRLPNVIQTDAPINPGNSGGALVGADGRLIGINSAILTAGSPANAGVGFAIPSNTAVDIANELISSGEVVYPFLGVQGQDVGTAAAARLGVERGAVVERVQLGTPAEEAGLRADDVITEVDDRAIESMDDLIIAIRQADIGDTVAITYIREERERTTDVTLVEMPEQP